MVRSYSTHPEVSTDERSFSKGWSDAVSLFCSLRYFSWTNQSIPYCLASGLKTRPLPCLTAIAMAIGSLPALPESSSTTMEILDLQKKPSLRKKVLITRLKVEVVNLLLHLQRHVICILSVLTTVRPLKRNLMEAEHVELKDL